MKRWYCHYGVSNVRECMRRAVNVYTALFTKIESNSYLLYSIKNTYIRIIRLWHPMYTLLRDLLAYGGDITHVAVSKTCNPRRKKYTMTESIFLNIKKTMKIIVCV